MNDTKNSGEKTLTVALAKTLT
ncbi:MAG: hypothetical protein RJB09_16, partial [Pseudomonadota bacterium]